MNLHLPPSHEQIHHRVVSTAKSVRELSHSEDAEMTPGLLVVGSQPAVMVFLTADADPKLIAACSVPVAMTLRPTAVALVSDNYALLGDDMTTYRNDDRSLAERWDDGDTSVVEAVSVSMIADGGPVHLLSMPYLRHRGHPIQWLDRVDSRDTPGVEVGGLVAALVHDLQTARFDGSAPEGVYTARGVAVALQTAGDEVGQRSGADVACSIEPTIEGDDETLKWCREVERLMVRR